MARTFELDTPEPELFDDGVPGVYKAVADPKSFTDAMSRPDADEWRKALHAELESLREIWHFVKMPGGVHVVNTLPVWTIKMNADGTWPTMVKVRW